MRELEVARGLLMAASVVDLGPTYLEGAMCGDASKKGYSLSYSWAGLEEVREAAQRRERWRFKAREVAPRGCPDDGRASAQFAHAGLAVGAAHAAGWAVEPPVGELPEARPRRRHKTELVEEVGAFELSERWSDPSRWALVVRGAWERDEVIHNLEGRVALMGLRRVCRSSRIHGRRVLCLTDNMAVAMSFDRGRSRDFGLNVLASRAAAYQLACNIIWIIRYVRSEANPTNHDCRAADRGEIPRGGVERGNGRRIGELIDAGAPGPVGRWPERDSRGSPVGHFDRVEGRHPLPRCALTGALPAARTVFPGASGAPLVVPASLRPRRGRHVATLPRAGPAPCRLLGRRLGRSSPASSRQARVPLRCRSSPAMPSPVGGVGASRASPVVSCVAGVWNTSTSEVDPTPPVRARPGFTPPSSSRGI